MASKIYTAASPKCIQAAPNTENEMMRAIHSMPQTISQNEA